MICLDLHFDIRYSTKFISQILSGTIRTICGAHHAYPMGGYEPWGGGHQEQVWWVRISEKYSEGSNVIIITSWIAQSIQLKLWTWYSGNQVDLKKCFLLMFISFVNLTVDLVDIQFSMWSYGGPLTKLVIPPQENL